MEPIVYEELSEIINNIKSAYDENPIYFCTEFEFRAYAEIIETIEEGKRYIVRIPLLGTVNVAIIPDFISGGVVDF